MAAAAAAASDNASGDNDDDGNDVWRYWVHQLKSRAWCTWLVITCLSRDSIGSILVDSFAESIKMF